MSRNGDCDIASVFDNATVFITGGSGFIGKITIDKILKIAPDVKRIYVLLRPKRQKSLEERVKEFFDYACFDELKLKHPNYIDKIDFLPGDVAKISLGLSAENWEKLVNEVNIILNLAADVRFNNHIRKAAYCNVRSVHETLRLAKEARQLKSFVHVSTAYSNYMHGRQIINEEFYKPGMSAEALYNILDVFDDEQLTAITPTLIGHWPNTYSYTKCIAEDLIRREIDNLPISVVRPGIINSTAEEPVPGWIDNFYGIAGITVGAGLGVVRVMGVKLSNQVFAVPCDYIMNLILAAAWYNIKNRNGSQQLHIFNYVGSLKNDFTYGTKSDGLLHVKYDITIIFVMGLLYNTHMSLEIQNLGYIYDYQKFGNASREKYPTIKAIGYPRTLLSDNYYLCKIMAFLCHTVPAYIADAVLFCLGKKTFAVRKIKKINELLELTSYYCITEFKFNTENVEKLWNIMDEKNKTKFNFNMDNFNWNEYWNMAFVNGLRYLLKEDPKDADKAIRRTKILYIIDRCFFALLIYVLVRFFVMPLLNLIF